METRALAIAFFYAIGTAIGGITGPFLFGKMIESGEESQVAIAFFLGAGVMAIGGIVELIFGVKAEQAELEDIAKPLTAQDAEEDAATGRPRRPERRGRDLGAEAAAPAATGGRYRLGPGRTGSSPGMCVSAPIAEREFSREIERIEQALAEHGPTERRELARLVGARFWGPGRFPAALREAVVSGRAQRIDRTRFGPASQRLSGHRVLLGGVEVEVAVVGAEALGDERRGGAAEHRCLRRRAAEREAAEEAGAERVAAPGRVDDLDVERGHGLDAVRGDDDDAVRAARGHDAGHPAVEQRPAAVDDARRAREGEHLLAVGEQVVEVAGTPARSTRAARARRRRARRRT